MKKQELKNKIGEIGFKKKLFSQGIGGKLVFRDGLNSENTEKILVGRMEKTRRHIQSLKNDGIIMSPYLELGAERGQRSLVMENDFNFKGVAADLSYDMLLSCDYYGRKFKKDKIPLRVCCDAYNLPLMSNSVPFIFCYQFLHHFPDPAPIIKEIIRVLSPGGCFFFGEEPCRGLLQLRLFKAKNKTERSTVKKLTEYFFYKKSCEESDYDIIENWDMPLSLWEKMFSPFKNRKISIESPQSLFNADIFGPRKPINLLLAHLFGGTIKGICQKEGVLENKFGFVALTLRCPDCAERKIESKLNKDEQLNLYFCNVCKGNYPEINKIQFLFPEKEFKQLYNQNNNRSLRQGVGLLS